MRTRDLLRSRENQKPGEFGRTSRIAFRVSPAEHALIKRAAADRGLSMGAYLVGLVLADGAQTVPDKQQDSKS